MRTGWTRRSVMAATTAVLGACASSPPRPSIGSVRRISDKLDALLPRAAVVELLFDGAQWAEGPVWLPRQEMLLFSDVPANVMYGWTQARGIEAFLRPSGFAGSDSQHLREAGSNGLARDGERLVYANSGDRCLTAMDIATRKRTVLADRFDGKRFNSPNDLVLSRSGRIYFTDPPYGLKDMERSPLRETPFAGVYCRQADGRVDLVDDTLPFPNGVGLSPDQKTLYVSCSDNAQPIIRAYALGEDGRASGARLFFDAAPLKAEGGRGNPDGLKVDVHGNLWASGPGGLMVISPQGELLGVISTGDVVSNCAFGGRDGRTLFLTSRSRLACIRTTSQGAG